MVRLPAVFLLLTPLQLPPKLLLFTRTSLVIQGILGLLVILALLVILPLLLSLAPRESNASSTTAASKANKKILPLIQAVVTTEFIGKIEDLFLLSPLALYLNFALD